MNRLVKEIRSSIEHFYCSCATTYVTVNGRLSASEDAGYRRFVCLALPLKLRSLTRMMRTDWRPAVGIGAGSGDPRTTSTQGIKYLSNAESLHG
jgi:hypothetical protein